LALCCGAIYYYYYYYYYYHYYYYYKSKDFSDASQKVAGALYKVTVCAVQVALTVKSRQKLSVTGTTAETNEPWVHVEKPSVMRQPWSVEADSSKPVLQPRKTRDRPE